MSTKLSLLTLCCYIGALAYNSGETWHQVVIGSLMGIPIGTLLMKQMAQNLYESGRNVVQAQDKLITVLKVQVDNLKEQNELLKDGESWKHN